MSQNPLIVAHKEARKNDKFLKSSFAKFLGSSNHPRGAILSIYRRGRGEMRSALKSNRFQVSLCVNDVLANMRQEIRGVGLLAVNASVTQGSESAQIQASAYQDAGQVMALAYEQPDQGPLVTGFMTEFERQAQAICALVASGAYDEQRIIGDEARLGILQPNPVAVNGAEWIATALSMALLTWWVGRDREPKEKTDFQKQAIAVVDDVTTDCCLKVNGQIRDFKKKFTLTGTPRFANKMSWSPFHHRCRTSIALYLESFDFGITDAIVEASKAELAKRKKEK